MTFTKPFVSQWFSGEIHVNLQLKIAFTNNNIKFYNKKKINNSMDSFENTIESYFLVFIFFLNWPMADQSKAVTLDNER